MKKPYYNRSQRLAIYQETFLGATLMLSLAIKKMERSNYRVLKEYPFFKVAVETPYPAEEINEFIALSGIDTEGALKLVRTFNEVGISSLKDVNILVKLGHFNK